MTESTSAVPEGGPPHQAAALSSDSSSELEAFIGLTTTFQMFACCERSLTRNLRNLDAMRNSSSSASTTSVMDSAILATDIISRMWALGWKASGVAQPTRVSRLAKRLKYRRPQLVISAYFERMCLPLHEL